MVSWMSWLGGCGYVEMKLIRHTQRGPTAKWELFTYVRGEAPPPSLSLLFAVELWQHLWCFDISKWQEAKYGTASFFYFFFLHPSSVVAIVIAIAVSMTNIRRQLTVIKSNAHTRTHTALTPQKYTQSWVWQLLWWPPLFFRGAYAAQIFLQQFRFVCWVNLLSVMRPFSTRNFLILFHFRLNCPPCSALLLYFLSYLLYFFFRDRFKLFSVETGTETESQSIQIGTWLTASNWLT